VAEDGRSAEVSKPGHPRGTGDGTVDAEEAVRDARPMRALALALALLPRPALAQEIAVQPYVQDRGPTSAWILWETTSGEESRVEWGPSEALGTSSTGGSIATEGTHRVHEVELSPLVPGTRYHYRVHTGAAVSASFHFTTPALAEAETSFRLVAVSDMQRDAANPEVWGRVVHDGILAQLAEEAPLPDEALSLVLLPGDLVHDPRKGFRGDDPRTEVRGSANGVTSSCQEFPCQRSRVELRTEPSETTASVSTRRCWFSIASTARSA